MAPPLSMGRLRAEPQLMAANMAKTKAPSDVPKNNGRKKVRTMTRLIDCIAAMPACGVIFDNDAIMNTEKAK